MESAFAFYKPKDIVAGDFYWLTELANNKILFAAADCTGHGVPGAMFSVVCQNALNEAVKDKKITHPAAILDAVNGIVEESFSSSNYLVRDGMEPSVC